MKISTTFFGTQEINEQEVITFPKGLPGLEKCTRFKLFHEEGKPTVFWLQSLDLPDITFSVAPPELFGLSYEFVLDDEEAKRVDLKDPNDALVLIILRRSEQETQATPIPGHPHINAHIKGPLVINPRARLGLQKVLGRLEQTTLLRAV